MVLLEDQCTGKALYEKTLALIEDKECRSRMRKALLSMAVPDSAERICDIMEQLIRAQKE